MILKVTSNDGKVNDRQKLEAAEVRQLTKRDAILLDSQGFRADNMSSSLMTLFNLKKEKKQMQAWAKRSVI